MVGLTPDEFREGRSSELVGQQEERALDMRSEDVSTQDIAYEDTVPGIEVEYESSQIYDRLFQEVLD